MGGPPSQCPRRQRPVAATRRPAHAGPRGQAIAWSLGHFISRWFVCVLGTGRCAAGRCAAAALRCYSYRPASALPRRRPWDPHRPLPSRFRESVCDIVDKATIYKPFTQECAVHALLQGEQAKAPALVQAGGTQHLPVSWLRLRCCQLRGWPSLRPLCGRLERGAAAAAAATAPGGLPDVRPQPALRQHARRVGPVEPLAS